MDVDTTGHHLHGGSQGLHKRVWEIERRAGGAVTFACTSKAGEGGYPGDLYLKVSYALEDQNILKIDYEAVTSAITVINLTNHAYFNLSGHDTGSVMDHELQISASRYLPLREDLIPMGMFADVKETPMDFTRARRIKEGIDDTFEQLNRASGYDHSWLLDSECATMDRPGAKLYAASTGIGMTVYTDQPSIQFYTGNSLPAQWQGKAGAVYGHRQGLCLETQHLPNSPNVPDFPSTVLHPGDLYRSSTRLHFTRDQLR